VVEALWVARPARSRKHDSCAARETIVISRTMAHVQQRTVLASRSCSSCPFKHVRCQQQAHSHGVQESESSGKVVTVSAPRWIDRGVIQAKEISDTVEVLNLAVSHAGVRLLDCITSYLVHLLDETNHTKPNLSSSFRTSRQLLDSATS
jgi:hypothetical protein